MENEKLEELLKLARYEKNYDEATTYLLYMEPFTREDYQAIKDDPRSIKILDKDFEFAYTLAGKLKTIETAEAKVVEEENLEQPAGIKLSSKDWHYKYMNWFWSDSLAPNKNNMFNLCPYFWLLAATLVLTPFVIPFRYFWKFVMFISTLIDTYIAEPIINTSAGQWFEKLTDIEVYQISDNRHHSNKCLIYMRKVFGSNIDNLDDYDVANLFAQHWLIKRNKINSKFGDNRWQLGDDYREWRREQSQLRSDARAEASAKKERFEKALDSFRSGVSDRAEAARDYMLSLNTIILWTKRIIGLIITLIMTVISFVSISFISKGILALINTTTWGEVLYVAMLVLIAAIVVGLMYGIGKLIEMSGKYGWKEYWWAQLFMYSIGYPLYYLIYTPGKILFYYFIYELILKNLFFGVKAILIGLKNGFIEFGGIFGQYFGSTKGDYCPGIEWDAEDEEK